MRADVYADAVATRIEGPLLFLRRSVNVGLHEAVEVEDGQGNVRLGRVSAIDRDTLTVEVLESTAGLGLEDTRVRFLGVPLTFEVGPEMLGSNCPRISYPTMPGNFVCYFVPGEDGSTRPGERLVNWAAYIPVPEDELPTFMVDRSGRPREGAIPPGEVRPEVEESLKAVMEAELPEYHGAMVRATEHTYVQLIYTAQMPAYHRGRACLIGDAGAVAQPFTGSGVFKGYNNVRSLLEVFGRHEDPVTALREWDAEQVELADRLLALGSGGSLLCLRLRLVVGEQRQRLPSVLDMGVRVAAFRRWRAR